MQLNLNLTFTLFCLGHSGCSFFFNYIYINKYLTGGFVRSNKSTLSKYLHPAKGGQGNLQRDLQGSQGLLSNTNESIG